MILDAISEMFHNAVNGKTPGLRQASALLKMRRFQGATAIPDKFGNKG